MPSLSLHTSFHPKADDIELLTNKLSEQAFRLKKLSPMKHFNLMLHDPEQQVHGGLTGLLYYGCLYIDQLWLSDEYRHQGYGTTLITEAEQLARQHNCRFATLCTMDWEGEPFYKKLGYQVEFVREGYDQDSKMIFMHKSLMG